MRRPRPEARAVVASDVEVWRRALVGVAWAGAAANALDAGRLLGLLQGRPLLAFGWGAWPPPVWARGRGAREMWRGVVHTAA